MATNWITDIEGGHTAVTAWTIRETTHCGGYTSRRATVDATPAGLSALLAGSLFNHSAARNCDHLARMFDELDHDGITELGWATYELMRATHPA